jgi:hypothetical protein
MTGMTSSLVNVMNIYISRGRCQVPPGGPRSECGGDERRGLPVTAANAGVQRRPARRTDPRFRRDDKPWLKAAPH